MKAAALSLLTFLCSDVAVTSAAMSAEEYVEQKVLTSDQCTTIAIGRKATLDGSTMCTDTMDCAECDL
jgi:FAD synthase